MSLFCINKQREKEKKARKQSVVKINNEKSFCSKSIKTRRETEWQTVVDGDGGGSGHGWWWVWVVVVGLGGGGGSGGDSSGRR